jgi:hypothetical protein
MTVLGYLLKYSKIYVKTKEILLLSLNSFFNFQYHDKQPFRTRVLLKKQQMEVLVKNIQVIPKESLIDIRFAQEDVLENDTKKRLRSIYLKKAEMLGNTYKGKVKMYFKTADGEIIAVETTIWYVDENHISLKGGINMPTKSVLAIEF